MQALWPEVHAAHKRFQGAVGRGFHLRGPLQMVPPLWAARLAADAADQARAHVWGAPPCAQYLGSRRRELRAGAKAAGKRLWMSEFGCGSSPPNGMKAALELSSVILKVLAPCRRACRRAADCCSAAWQSSTYCTCHEPWQQAINCSSINLRHTTGSHALLIAARLGGCCRRT